MTNLKDTLLLNMLEKHGFSDKHVEVSSDKLVFSNFQSQIPAEKLNKEGAPIPHSNHANYHNYIYPKGLIPGWEQIEVQEYSDTHQYKGRIQKITLPLSVFDKPDFDVEIFVANINLTHGYNHSVVVTGEPEKMELTVDYSSGAGGKPGDDLLKAVLGELVPRIAHVDDLHGPNFVSDLGRIAPLILTATIEQAFKSLRQYQTETHLLTLKDEINAAPSSSNPFVIEKAPFHRELEKLAREQQLLAQTVIENLNMSARNWIAVDENLLGNYQPLAANQSASEQKLSSAVDLKTAPLFISTTNGGHAFALMVDFKTKTLHLANATGNYVNFETIIKQIKRVTGCDNIKHAITQPMQREGDIDFSDTCTADAVVLAHMLMKKESSGPLNTGALDGQTLRTAHYLQTKHTSSPPLAMETKSTPRETSVLNQPLQQYPRAETLFAESLRHIMKTAETPTQMWHEASQKLLNEYVYPHELEGADTQALIEQNPKSRLRKIDYSLLMIDENTGESIDTVIKPVSEAVQIAMDELYAKKLAAEQDDNEDRCFRM